MKNSLEGFQAKCQDFFSSLWPGETKTLVFGVGQANQPRLMLIGEAPGEQEVRLGRPFVGKAGKNLTAFLESVAIDRADIYISNVVKIRPTRVSTRGRVSNRPPSREEKLLFTPFLMEEIGLVRPEMLVTLGNVALQTFAGANALIGQAHGRLTETEIAPPQGEPFRLPLFPLYHPASIIYNPGLQAVYDGDLRALKALLHQAPGKDVN